MMLLLKTYQKWLFYHLPRSFKIFMNVFAFLYVKANSKLRKSVKKEYFLLFSRKKLSAFLFKFKANRPFPSALVPLFQNESKCETFHMKMSSACSFIFMQISHFHKNGFALRLALKQRYKGTRKWPIIPPSLR